MALYYGLEDLKTEQNVKGKREGKPIPCRVHQSVSGAESDLLGPFGKSCQTRMYPRYKGVGVIKTSDPKEDHYFVGSLGQTRVSLTVLSSSSVSDST